VTFWTAAYALELAGPDLETIRFWGDVKYLGILLLPPAWLTFVLHYTERRHWLTARRMALLAVVPALTVVVLANGATRELFRWYPDLEPGRDIPSAVIGPLFWVHAVYTYGCCCSAGSSCCAAPGAPPPATGARAWSSPPPASSASSATSPTCWGSGRSGWSTSRRSPCWSWASCFLFSEPLPPRAAAYLVGTPV